MFHIFAILILSRSFIHFHYLYFEALCIVMEVAMQINMRKIQQKLKNKHAVNQPESVCEIFHF